MNDYALTSAETKELREKALDFALHSPNAATVYALIRIGDLLWQIKEDERAIRGGVKEEE